MSSNGPAVRVSGAFKKFRRGERADTLRDVIGGLLRRRRRGARADGVGAGEFWALHDVSFSVEGGEALGIIGPNGAGKSTMLKLLAGLMRPTRGTVEVRGRVSAMIELGAGFHPDLTGRENILLNAAILGMRRAEVRRRFDQIVEFAEVGEFLDMPLKRYSSGMHARLGFAIAAHVEPAVLLVDEVLSVGDRVFRARCMEKMREFLRRGVAIVFVSHDLGAVSSFCRRAMVLSEGRSIFSGPATEAVARYHEACVRPVLARQDARATPVACAARPVRVSNVRVEDAAGRETSCFSPGEAARLLFDVDFFEEVARPSFGLSVARASDRLVVFETSSTRLEGESGAARVCGATGHVRAGDRRRVGYEMALNLLPGEYVLGVHVRGRDSREYAFLSMDVARVFVTGEATAGGVAHLEARVEVQARREAGRTAAVGAGAAS